MFHWYQVSIGEDEKVWEIMAMVIVNIINSQNFKLNMVKMANLVLYTFYHDFKK